MGHTLALVWMCGCYAHHEVEFEELPVGCDIEPTFYEALDCPTGIFVVGDSARVELRHRVGVCCNSGVSDVAVDHPSANEWTLTSTWTACECDELLDCLGPGATTTLRIDPLSEGENVIRAGELECVIRAERDAACMSAPGDYVAPRVLFDDQPFSASLFHEASADCDCELRLDDRALRLCECSDGCDRVFTSYSGSFVGDIFTPGEHAFPISDTTHSLSVRELEPPLTPGAGCRTLEPTDLSFVLPTAHHVGPRLIWAGVTGEQSLCCSPELLLAVRELRSEEHEIDLQLFSCVFEDCLCGVAPPPTINTAWHDLGELDPGEYTVRVGDLVETLVVP